MKLAGFAVLLALVFGASAFAGGRIDPQPLRAAAGSAGDGAGDGAHGGGMGEMDEAGAPAVRGLAVADRGLRLELGRTTAPRGRRVGLAFRIVDRRGHTVRAFDVEHTRRMHLIVVRRDFSGFQHLHPRQLADGSWSVPLTLRDAGAYRVFADFSARGGTHTLAGDLAVDGPVRTRPLPAPSPVAEVDGLLVRLAGGATHAGAESSLSFAVTRAGKPVAIADYLGAKGHLVALREGDLAFLHVHPDARRLRFMAEFPEAGRHRLFLQFKTADGRLHTAAFTREVTR